MEPVSICKGLRYSMFILHMEHVGALHLANLELLHPPLKQEPSCTEHQLDIASKTIVFLHNLPKPKGGGVIVLYVLHSQT